MVILLFVVWSLFEDQKLYTKSSFPYSHMVTCPMKPIWRSKFIQQIVLSLPKYGYLSYGAYLKIQICTPNSPLCVVTLHLVHWSLFVAWHLLNPSGFFIGTFNYQLPINYNTFNALWASLLSCTCADCAPSHHKQGAWYRRFFSDLAPTADPIYSTVCSEVGYDFTTRCCCSLHDVGGNWLVLFRLQHLHDNSIEFSSTTLLPAPSIFCSWCTTDTSLLVADPLQRETAITSHPLEENFIRTIQVLTALLQPVLVDFAPKDSKSVAGHFLISRHNWGNIIQTSKYLDVPVFQYVINCKVDVCPLSLPSPCCFGSWCNNVDLCISSFRCSFHFGS